MTSWGRHSFHCGLWRVWLVKSCFGGRRAVYY